MLLLWPKEPVRAEPDKVIEFRLSTPIAFEAAAMTELAFCAARPIDSETTTSTATVIFPSRITDPPIDFVFRIGNCPALLRMVCPMRKPKEHQDTPLPARGLDGAARSVPK